MQLDLSSEEAEEINSRGYADMTVERFQRVTGLRQSYIADLLKKKRQNMKSYIDNGRFIRVFSDRFQLVAPEKVIGESEL